MVRGLVIVVICILIVIFTYLQIKNDNSQGNHDNSPPGNRTSRDDANKLRKTMIYASILAVLGFAGSYVVDAIEELERNQEKASSDTANDEEIISQEKALAGILQKKNIFTMEADWDKLFQKAPNVEGLTQEAAGNRLETEGIPWRIGDSIYSDTAEAGIVLSQTPKPGYAVTEHTAVALVISKGVEPVQVPNVVGLPQGEAQNSLKRAGLKVVAKEKYSDTVKAGTVMEQSESGEAYVSPKTEVEITVSKGPKPKEEEPQQTAAQKPSGSSSGSGSSSSSSSSSSSGSGSSSSGSSSSSQGAQEGQSQPETPIETPPEPEPTQDPDKEDINDWPTQDPDREDINDWSTVDPK